MPDPITQYIDHYALLATRPETLGQWDRVMVIPCYREEPAFLDSLSAPPEGLKVLVICVLNRPAHDPDPAANDQLREQLNRTRSKAVTAHCHLHRLTRPIRTDLLSLDLERLEGPTPSSEGVGRARRVGFDLALWLIQSGQVRGDWIASYDADSCWPTEHLHQDWPVAAGAACLPFRHTLDPDSPLGQATLLYELRLHYYVLGLSFANSPYAHHTLGSSMAVRASTYAKVRGMPLRSGGEDFYLLSKVAKVAPVHRVTGTPVSIEARASARVPFGTGPAVQRLLEAGEPLAAPLFYHFQCFAMLRVALSGLVAWANDPSAPWRDHIHSNTSPSMPVTGVLEQLGLDGAIAHAHRQGKDAAARLRHLQTWFDGFRTLKFVHTVRDLGYADTDFQTSLNAEPLWPSGPIKDPYEMREALLRHWNWQTQ